MKKLYLRLVVVGVLVLFLFSGCDTVKSVLPELPEGIPSFNEILSRANLFLTNEIFPSVEREIKKLVEEHISDDYQYMLLVTDMLGTSANKIFMLSRQGNVPADFTLKIRDVSVEIKEGTFPGFDGSVRYADYNFRPGETYLIEASAAGRTSTVELRIPHNLSVHVFPEYLPLTEAFDLKWHIEDNPTFQTVTVAGLSLNNNIGAYLHSSGRLAPNVRSHILPANITPQEYYMIRVDAANYAIENGIIAVAWTDSWKGVNLPIPVNYDYMLTIIENLDIPMWDVSHRIMFVGRGGLSADDLTLKVNGVEIPKQSIPLLSGTYFNYNFEKGVQYELEASAGGKTSRVLLTIPRNLSVTNWPSNYDNTAITNLNWANTGARHQVFNSWVFTDRFKNEFTFRALPRLEDTHTIGAGNKAHIAFLRLDAMNFEDRNGFVFLSTSTSWRAYQNVIDIGFDINNIKIW